MERSDRRPSTPQSRNDSCGKSGDQTACKREHLLGTLVIPCLGFALLRAFIMMLDEAQVYTNDYAPFLAGNLGRGCGPLLVIALIGARPLAMRTLLRGFIPCALVSGTLGALIVGGVLTETPAILVIGRGICLACLGWLYVCWGEVYRNIRIRDVAISMIASMVVSSVLAFICALLPTPFVALFAFAIPCIAVWLLMVFDQKGYPVQEDRLQFGPYGDGSAIASYGPWLVALALFSVAMGVAHILSVSNPNDYADMVSFSIYTAVSIVCAVLLLASVVLRGDVFSLPLCWTLFLVATCALLGASLVFPSILQIALAAFSGIRYIALAYLNIKLIDIAHHTKMPLYVALALGWGIVHLFMALGMSVTLNGVYTGLAVSVPLILLLAILAVGSVCVFGGSTFGDVRVRKPVSGSDDAVCTESETMLNAQYRRCLAVREKYGLTERETEVVFLIAQGFTQAYCADALMVSLNTVRTHMKRVYAKMGIHAKDELLEELEKAS